MKHFFSIFTFLIISIAFTYGQNITYDGNVTDMDSEKAIGNVTVTVYANGSVVTSSKTSPGGAYSVNFLPGKNYTVKYTKPGYVTKIILLDVSDVVGEDMPAGGKIFPPINLDLFKERVGTDFSFLETEPVVKWELDGERMNYNKGQMTAVKSKIEAKLKAAQDKEKNLEAEYNQLIKDADAFYASKKYQEALNKYVAALQIEGKQKEAHPNAQLLKIEDLLQKQEEEELASQQENQAYLNLITAADNFAGTKEYDKAIAKYNEAIAMKSDEQYPKDRVKDLKEEIANAAKKDEFDKIVKRADGFFKQNSLQAARDTYQQALKILPNEEYPKKQLEIISGKLDAQLAIKEQKDKYNEAVNEADNLYNAEKYEEAIAKYEEALTFESAATYPPGRIKMAQDILDERAAEAEKLALFNKLVAEADAGVASKDFEIAVAKYTEAIAIKEDTAVQTKLDNAKKLLADQKNKEQQKEQIATLMASAQEKMTAEDYANAITDYSGVLALLPTHPEALAGKAKAEGLLVEKQALAEKESKFNELVAAADKAFTAKTWQEAKTKYVAAKAIYDDREHVNNRIAEVETKIAEEGLNDQIGTLMASAKEKVTAENYAGAIADFDAVLGLKADHTEAITGKKNAEDLLAQQEAKKAQEEEFNTIVAQADAAFGKENWEEAKEKYLAAKAIYNDKEHVNSQLALVDKAMADALTKQEDLAKIQTLLTEATALKPDNKWTEVIQKYEQALAIKPERNDIIELLAAAKVSKQEWEAAQSQEATNTQIQTLLDEASALKPDNKWTDVIQKYEQALALDNERNDISEMLAAAKVSKQEWEAAQSKEALETEFNAIVAEADVAFERENWTEARDKYLSAKSIFADREHVNTRIDEVNTALASLQANQESAAQIQTLLAEATALKPDNKWSEVIQKYEAALAIDETRNDVSELLSSAKESKAAWEAAQSQGEQFEQLKQAGNELLAQEKWNEAKSKYEEALQLKTDSEIDTKLEIIETKLAEIAASENKEQQYTAKMKAAEDFASAEEYQKAITTFKEALVVKQGDATATERISEIQEKLDALAQAENLNQEYTEAMNVGNAALENKDYSAAVKAFDDALLVIPADAQALALKAQAKSKIAELQAEEEEYKAFVESALAKYDEAIAEDNNIAKLQEAKTIFGSAQNVRPEASLPQTKIVEIDNLLRQIEENAAASNQAAENERLYNEQLQLASVAAQGKEYKNAIEYLKEAQRIKPEESFPTAEISKYQAILDNANAAKELEANYTSLISRADEAFGNSDYQNSIDLYNEALSLKKNEAYPKEQIVKAEEGIANNALNMIEEEYQNFMEKANTQFANKDFENALASYKSALAVKENDSDAKDKIDETQQILDNLLKAKKASESLKQQFDQLIADADQLFKDEKYLEASSAYRNALKIEENDTYASKQLQLSIDKAKEQNDQKRDKRYNQSISAADNFFKNEEYESAKAAYQRALGFRNYEQYPKTQLAKITALINAKVKAQGSVAYIGEQRNISIIEGAALLEQGELQRKRIKQEKVLNSLGKFEGEEADRSLSDFEERLEYENEVTSIKDIRDNANITDIETKREIADEVDNQMIEFEKGAAEYNRFKEGDLSRTSQALVFANDDFDQEKADFRALHKESIEQVKAIENERNNLNATESAHHDVMVTATSEELVVIDKAYEDFNKVNEEFQQETERQVNAVRYGIDDRTVVENNDLYEKVIDLQDHSILAEMKVSESTEEKDIIQQQLKEDIIVHEAALQRKLATEASEVHQEQIIIDDQLTAAGNQFVEAQEGKDDSRLKAVEQLKDIEQDQLKQREDRIEVKKNTTEEIYLEVEGVKTLQEESARQNVKDLTVVDDDVTNRMTVFEKGRQKQENEEIQANQVTESKIQSIDKREELLREENVEELQNTYQELKGQQIRIEDKNQNIDNKASKEKQTTQSYVDGLENNDIKFTETIANTIGDDYPEGVTQENYVREDSKGIPIKIVTRRIVVTDGRGEVYIRTQTRNGLTYSKNGSPITEQNWIYGTENANLEKHY